MSIKDHPCKDGLTPECIKEHPEWARKMFAYRLLITVCPQKITKRLPKLRGLFPLIFPENWEKDLPWLPGYSLDPETVFPPDWKPEDSLPAGVTLSPETVFPPDWKPGDSLPNGITFILSAMFPPGWRYEDGLPPGVTYAPGAMFPPVWTTGDNLPAGQINGISQRPAVMNSGVIAPLYTGIENYVRPYRPAPVVQGNVQVKLYRGDGTLLTGYYGGPDPGDLITWLYLYNSSDAWISTTVSYDSGTGYWTFVIDNEEDIDENGYWVTYDCRRGLYTQYPYRYRAADKKESADLVKEGKIVDIIPYSHISLGGSTIEDECIVLINSYINDAGRWTTNRLSVPYDIIYTLLARSAVVGDDYSPPACMGVDWILTAPGASFGPIVSTWEWSDTSYTEADNSATVEIPTAIATEIATILGGGSSPDWTAFNAQFPGIAIGSGGIGERIHTATFNRNASTYQIRTTAWKEVVTIY